MTIERTTNYRLPIPQANQTPWQQYYRELVVVLDSVIARFVSISQFKGLWLNTTAYIVGDKAVDPEQGVIYQAQRAHTSAASPTLFAADRAANDTYWAAFSTAGVGRGAWAQGTMYSIGDFVDYSGRFAVCLVSHTASDYVTDLAAGKWSELINLTAYTPVATPVVIADGGTGATTAAGARTALGVAIGSDVQAYNAALTSIATATLGTTGLLVLAAATETQGRSALGLGSVATESTVPVAKGGTGSTTAADARTALGVAATSHTHAIADLTDDGALAALNTVGTSQIDNAAVTYAKIQDTSAASKLIGRGSASGAGDVEEITLGTGLSMSGTTLSVSTTAGLTLIDSEALSAAASCTLTGIDSTYDSFLIVGWMRPANDGVLPRMHLSTDGGSTFLSSASDGFAQPFDTDMTTANQISLGSSGLIRFLQGGTNNRQVGNDAGDSFAFEIFCNNLAGSTRKKFRGSYSWTSSDATGTDYGAVFFAGNTGTTAINAIKFDFSAGNIAAGWIGIYGYKRTV